MDTGEHIKNNTDDDSQSSAVFGRMRKHKDPLISALNQRVLGSSPSASTKLSNSLAPPLKGHRLRKTGIKTVRVARRWIAAAIPVSVGRWLEATLIPEYLLCATR